MGLNTTNEAPITFVECTEAEHGMIILDILNHAIINSTALYDYQPRPPASMGPWFEAKRKGGYPVIGAVSAQGTLIGFASYGAFRAWPAYKYTVEHSVYVHHDHRGRGAGESLLRQIILRAREQNYHVIVGGIDADNQASIRLHERLGFAHTGTIKQVGFKFGRWLDLSFYQLILATPSDPQDG
ncbi:MAG: GNAT family N-acetyltransferase [Nodosilinea sp.]